MDGALNELKFIVGLFREGPVLVLANKQDVSGCLSLSQIRMILDLDNAS